MVRAVCAVINHLMLRYTVIITFWSGVRGGKIPFNVILYYVLQCLCSKIRFDAHVTS